MCTMNGALLGTKAFFPGISEGSAFKVIGEFSPGYLSDNSAPERIKRNLVEIKLLAILRNPADRAYSQWKLRVQKRAENRSFEDFVKNDEESIKLGLYGSHIERYLKEFSKDSLHIIIFERAINEPRKALECRFRASISPSISLCF